jgi:hypothetical protein
MSDFIWNLWFLAYFQILKKYAIDRTLFEPKVGGAKTKRGWK